MWDFGFLGLIFVPYVLAFLFWILPLYCLTLLLYKYKPHYVNLALHIGVWGVWYCFILSFQNSIFNRNGLLWIAFVQEIPHLAFTLYAIIYARKFDTQKIPFRKRLGRYIASFFIGIGLFIVSFVIMFAIGYCISSMYYSNWSTPDYTQKDRYEAMNTILSIISVLFFIAILSLLSHILYKNHKPFFTKIFDRILSMVGKRKP